MKVNQFQPYLGDEEYKAIKSCFDKNWITEGPKTNEFSENLLELMGSKYGVFAQNGTMALYLGLRAIDIGPGDEVIVPAQTHTATAHAVEYTGAKAVLVDSEFPSGNISLKEIKKNITKRTKGLIVVHMGGYTCYMT